MNQQLERERSGMNARTKCAGSVKRGSGRVGRIPPMRSGGFTLMEVMIVVVILGILATLIVPNIISRPDEARVQAARIDIKQIESALNMYRLDNGVYPSTDQGLEALVSPPSGFPEAPHWNPNGYLSKIPVDPWDQPYLYLNSDNQVEVYSYGADRKEGGEGFDADIMLSDL